MAGGAVRRPTGILRLDASLGGGLAEGECHEFVEAAPGLGGQMLVHALLQGSRREARFLALVEAGNAFDPQSAAPEELEALLWVRCTRAREGLLATDILVRDENIPLVLLDLREAPEGDFSGLRDRLWRRVILAARGSGCTLAVLTPRPCVPACRQRVRLRERFSLDAVEEGVENLKRIEADGAW